MKGVSQARGSDMVGRNEDYVCNLLYGHVRPVQVV